MQGHRRIRWYNPKLGGFEWRDAPESDKDAFLLFEESPETRVYMEQVYREWRELGAGIVASLIRAGEAAHEMDEERRRGESES
jgi:hypothetical protein